VSRALRHKDAALTHDADRLMCLLAGCLSDDPDSAIREIETDGLWEYIASLACNARLGGLLIHTLRARNMDIPDSAVLQMEAYREYLVAANDYNTSRVEEILRQLSAAGVPFMLLKGAAMNATVYEPGCRGMVDIDVLIQPCDVERVDHLLQEGGCTHGKDLVQDDFYPRFYYEREYFTPHTPAVKIDLHVRPFRPLRYAQTVPDGALWDEPVEVSFGQVRAKIPSPENMLIHLCGHAACHGLGELRWLYDIKQWFDYHGSRMDPQRVADKCRAWSLSLPVREALIRTQKVFHDTNPICDELITKLAHSGNLRDWLVFQQAPHDDERRFLALVVNLLCTPGIHYRLGYLKAVLVPARAHMGQLYRRRHTGWLAVAHLVRVWRSLTRPLTPTPATS